MRSPRPITSRGRCLRNSIASFTRASNESNSRRLGRCSSVRRCTPSASPAALASAMRDVGPGRQRRRLAVGQVDDADLVARHRPEPASVPPQAISTSSGWAPTAITSSWLEVGGGHGPLVWPIAANESAATAIADKLEPMSTRQSRQRIRATRLPQCRTHKIVRIKPWARDWRPDRSRYRTLADHSNDLQQLRIMVRD